jgi:hypothetical protein
MSKLITEIDNNRIAEVARIAAEQLPKAIGDGEIQILRDYQDAVAAAHESEDEKLPKLKLAFAITFDPNRNVVDTNLNWTASRSIKESIVLDDPDQMKLPMTEAAENLREVAEKVGGSVTVSVGDKKVLEFDGSTRRTLRK